MADEHHVPLHVVEDAAQHGSVTPGSAQWVGGGDDRISLLLEAFDDAVSAEGVGESAVLEHDGRLLALVLVWSRWHRSRSH
jgi:hypothetical protein